MVFKKKHAVGNGKQSTISSVKVQYFVDPSIDSDLLPMRISSLYNNVTLFPPLLKALITTAAAGPVT